MFLLLFGGEPGDSNHLVLVAFFKRDVRPVEDIAGDDWTRNTEDWYAGLGIAGLDIVLLLGGEGDYPVPIG